MTEFREIDFTTDYDQVVDLIEKWWYKSPLYSIVPVPYMPSKPILKNMWLNGSMIGIVGYEDGELIAAYIGLRVPYMFNPFYLQATDILWHVREDKRKGTTTSKLIKNVEAMMDRLKINIWSLTFSQDTSYDVVAKGLLKHGFKPMDRNFIKFDRRLGDN